MLPTQASTYTTPLPSITTAVRGVHQAVVPLEALLQCGEPVEHEIRAEPGRRIDNLVGQGTHLLDEYRSYQATGVLDRMRDTARSSYGYAMARLAACAAARVEGPIGY
jgi:hypothetical protein